MRERPPSRRGNAAPRYDRVAADDAVRIAAYNERAAAAARHEAARFFYDLRQGLRLARVAVANRLGDPPRNH